MSSRPRCHVVEEIINTQAAISCTTLGRLQHVFQLPATRSLNTQALSKQTKSATPYFFARALVRFEAAAIELLLALRAPQFLLPASFLKLGARRFARFVQLRRLNNRAGACQHIPLGELLERFGGIPVVSDRLAQRLYDGECRHKEETKT